MRVIPTRIHGVLDYVLGIVLAVLPFVAGFADGGVAEWASGIVGCGLILYSLLTNYELGVFRVIPVPVHLGLDALGGVVLILVALAFAPAPAAWLPLLLLGLIELASSLTTQRETSDRPGTLASPGNLSRSSRDVQAMPAASGPSTRDGRPAYRTGPEGVETVEQLRGAIDSGRTNDKIAVTDPAAAPLGSDDEAAQGHDEAGLRTARQADTRAGSR